MTRLSYLRIGAACAICTLGVLTVRAAEPLTEQGALKVAKRHLQKHCTSDTPCSFSAMRRNELWLVEVTFTKRDAVNGRPYSYPGGHATILIDGQGKVVKRIDGDAH